MELIKVYGQLEALLRRLGVAVRCEEFDEKLFGDLSVKGGLCTLRGRTVVLVDAKAPLVDRVWVLADALSSFDIEALFMTPSIKEIVALRRARNAMGRRPIDISDRLQYLPHFPKEPENTVHRQPTKSRSDSAKKRKPKRDSSSVEQKKEN